MSSFKKLLPAIRRTVRERSRFCTATGDQVPAHLVDDAVQEGILAALQLHKTGCEETGRLLAVACHRAENYLAAERAHAAAFVSL